jgi:hypothetical protein
MKYTVAELAENFTRALSEIARALDEAGAVWMLVGGLAVGGWTEPRATKDLPCWSRPSVAGVVVSPAQLADVAEGGPLRLHTSRPGEPSLVIDFLCVGTPFEREALSRRRVLTLFGVQLFVASPDDLLIYKLIAARPQDLADVDRLIRFGRCPEDESYVRRWARDWDVEERLGHALAVARRDAP